MARKIYGIYKDDLPACIGTEDECALFLETTINTFRSMYSKQKKRKIKRSREMKAKKETESIYRVVVNLKEGKRYLNVLFEAYKAFVGEIEKNDSIVWDGEMKIENLRVIKLAQIQGLRNKKKVRIGDTVYSSIAECARKNFISASHMYQMIEGIRPNSIGVEFV